MSGRTNTVDHGLGDRPEVKEGEGTAGQQQGMPEVFASLSSMRVEVEGLRNPMGTFHSPARTCKELHMLNPALTDGRGTHGRPPWPPRRLKDESVVLREYLCMNVFVHMKCKETSTLVA